MKIALAIFRYFPHGGLQRDFLRIAVEALRRGHEVTVFTSRFDGDAPPGLRVKLLSPRGCSNHARAAGFERQFAAEAKDFGVRFGFNRMAGLDFYFAADNCLAGDAQKKYPSWWLKISPRYRTFLRQEAAVAGVESATRIFYIVERQKRDFQRCYGTPEARFFYLPPGLNDACFRAADADGRRAAKRGALGLRPDEILLLLVGSFFEGKGVDRLLRAVAALPEPEKSRCRIGVVGAVKPAPCRKLAARLQLPENMLLLPGACNDVPDWLLAADLMVHPARKEATGTVIIEALAAGLPVIASGECGFASFAAEAGGTELDVPFRQEELDRVLASALAPGELERLKEAARRYGACADFRRRAACAVDALERFHA